MTDNPLRNITRLDDGGRAGWWVRVERNRQRYSCLFSDGAYGGKRAALAAATAWRDELRAELPEPERGERSDQSWPGHGYVRRAVVARKGRQVAVWKAWLRVEDKRAKQTSYTVAQWGEDGARARAEEWLEAERVALLERMAGR